MDTQAPPYEAEILYDTWGCEQVQVVHGSNNVDNWVCISLWYLMVSITLTSLIYIWIAKLLNFKINGSFVEICFYTWNWTWTNYDINWAESLFEGLVLHKHLYVKVYLMDWSTPVWHLFLESVILSSGRCDIGVSQVWYELVAKISCI